MKIECVCGDLIQDMTDGLPHKAHIIPDQSWHSLFDALDALTERRSFTRAQRNAACMAMRTLIIEASRSAWQCNSCGRLYLDDNTECLQIYVPADSETSREVLSGANRTAPYAER